jgi:hypothetical protein
MLNCDRPDLMQWSAAWSIPLSVGCGTMRVGAAARASVEQSSPVRFTQSQVAVVPIHSTVVYTRTT